MLRSEEGGGGIFEKLYPWGKQALRRRCHDMKRDFETPEVRAICFGGDVNALSYIDNAINIGMPPIFHAYPNTMSMHNNASPKNFYRKSPPEKHVDTRFLLAFKVPKLEPSREHLV